MPGTTSASGSRVSRRRSKPAAHFLRLTFEKLRPALHGAHGLTEAELSEAFAALLDPSLTLAMPLTVAAWGWRP